MQGKDVTIHVKPVDGQWETLGVDRMRGVFPEDPVPEVDKWGPSKATFVLKRDGSAPWPDLLAFTEVEIDVGGVPVWGGRIAETPNTGLGLTTTVECKGWQYHLDDDVLEKTWVHTDLGAWKDVRSFLSAQLGTFPQVGNVSADGALTVGWAKDSTVPNVKAAAVGVDLGPGSSAKRIVVTYEWVNGTGNGNQHFGCYASDTGVGASGADAVFDVNPGTGSTSGTQRATLSTARRYLWLQVHSAAGSDFNATDELRCRITSVQIFSDTAYESGDASVLTSDVVVTDALDAAIVLLSPDRSRIEVGTFAIPELAPDGPRTPRQLIEAVNAYEDNRCAVDAQKRVVFEQKATVPDIVVGAWGGMEFTDASAGSAEEIYSRVIVTGQDAAGQPVRVERTQAALTGSVLELGTSPAATNPSFATDTAGWTAGTSTITRDTGTYHTSPASGRWDNTGASDALGLSDTLTATFTGTFRKGVTYGLQIPVRASIAGSSISVAQFGTATDYSSSNLLSIPAAFTTFTLRWTPIADAASVSLRLFLPSAGYFWFDSLAVGLYRPTIVDRQGFRRTHVLDVGFPLTTLAGRRLADKFLAAHRTTPFKGRLTLTGDLAARDYRTGDPVPLERLLLRYGGLIHFSDRVDPDTGAWGRDGRIVQATYNHAKSEATVEIDNTRADFAQMLERLGAYVGQLR